ncbi:unnamed protein product [Adineta steineri]|uniref:Pentapeptide repeat-containing protein n=1 Tax=Adineta steineri TaxID=433720 RepID=A0A813TY65_9BILA|nr:unnamed protein product [Adineta steineri]
MLDCLKTKGNEVGKSKCSILALLQLLATLSVPLAIGLYTIVHKTNESDLARQNRRKDLDIAGGNRAKDESIANEVRKENILVEYQNSLAKILLDHGMTLNGSVSARFVVRVKTLTAVKQLDTVRKAFLIQSLYEANLITTAVSTESIISLEGADLNKLHLGSTEDDTERPSHACLSLAGAILTNASFRLDNLNGANFTNAKLRFADFTDSRTDYGQYCYHKIPPLSVSFHSAILNEANFMTALYDNAIFTYAKMSKANLQKFTCRYCNVVGANLSEADLTGVTFNGPANIGWAKFINSKLINASFTDGVNFQQSDFTRANANGISFRQSLFGFMAYRNVQRSPHYTKPLIRRELDRQLTVMVLVQVLVNIFTLLPYAIVNILSLQMENTNNLLLKTQVQLASNITLIMYYVYYANPFYIYICASERFRRQLIHVLFTVPLNRWKRQPRIIINQVLPQL